MKVISIVIGGVEKNGDECEDNTKYMKKV